MQKLTGMEAEMLERVFTGSNFFNVGGNWNLSELSFDIEQDSAYFRKPTKAEQRALNSLEAKGLITRIIENSLPMYRYSFDARRRAWLAMCAVEQAIEHHAYYWRQRSPQHMPTDFPHDFETYKAWARETSIDGEYQLQMLEQLAARVEIDAMRGIAA